MLPGEGRRPSSTQHSTCRGGLGGRPGGTAPKVKPEGMSDEGEEGERNQGWKREEAWPPCRTNHWSPLASKGQSGGRDGGQGRRMGSSSHSPVRSDFECPLSGVSAEELEGEAVQSLGERGLIWVGVRQGSLGSSRLSPAGPHPGGARSTLLSPSQTLVSYESMAL